MKSLRLPVIFLIIGLSIFFNIERLDFGAQDLINIDSIVYIIGLMTAISVIGVPLLRRANLPVLFILWIFVYLFYKLFSFYFFYGRPLLGDIYTYLSITEISLLLLVAWLAHRVVSPLEDFEESVKKFTFVNNKRIKQMDDADEEIQLEMFRSRHSHRPLSVVMVELKPEALQAALNRAVQEVQHAMLSSYMVNNIARTLGKYLRRTDLILEQRDQGRFLILCPDTTSGDLKLLVEYIQAVASEEFGTPIAYGVATFPDQAITFEELVHQAESHLQYANGNGRL